MVPGLKLPKLCSALDWQRNEVTTSRQSPPKRSKCLVEDGAEELREALEAEGGERGGEGYGRISCLRWGRNCGLPAKCCQGRIQNFISCLLTSQMRL